MQPRRVFLHPTASKTTTTAPNSPLFRPGSSLFTSADAAATNGPQEAHNNQANQASLSSTPSTHPDEPFLYEIPSQLRPVYGKLPFLVKIFTFYVSMLISALFTCKSAARWSLLWLRPVVASLKNGNLPWRTLLSFAVKTALLTALSNAMYQDIFLPPSRVTVQQLLQDYTLPSKLSRYENVSFLPGTWVHFLEYNKDQFHKQDHTNNYPSTDEHVFSWDAIYTNHGFGASSLSWLPILPRLVERFRARVGLGHDAVGFGFTDRPKGNVEAYRSTTSARIGLELLQSRLGNTESSSGASDEHDHNHKNVLLVGHSMGSLATLRMALDAPPDVKPVVVLVAPALGMSPGSNGLPKNHQKHGEMSVGGGPLHPPRLTTRLFVDRPARYLLRRTVSSHNFWRKGLQLAWGDPQKVTSSDVVRFQWPALGTGWEQAMLDFSRAQLLPAALTDNELLQKVLDRGVPVHVIIGSKDRVVSPGMLKRFLRRFPSVQVSEMPGLGHDPFEEDVDGFLDVMERVLKGQGSEQGCSQ